MMKFNCFDVLQVPETVSAEELRHAYRRLVRRWHPDQYADAPELREIAQERLKLINTAYRDAKVILSAGDRGRGLPPRRPANGFSAWLRALFRSRKVSEPRPRENPGSEVRHRPMRAGVGRDFEAIFQDAVRARRAASGGAALHPHPRPVRRDRGPSLTRGRSSGSAGRKASRVERIRQVRRVEKV
jgi:curved DNA-binding protein CbpA